MLNEISSKATVLLKADLALCDVAVWYRELEHNRSEKVSVTIRTKIKLNILNKAFNINKLFNSFVRVYRFDYHKKN